MRKPIQRLLLAVVASVTLTAAALLGAVGTAGATPAVKAPPAAPAAAAAATTSCSAAYSVQTDWGTGFTASLTVTNNGTAAITGWTVTWTYAGNQKLSSGWSGTWSQSGETVTVANASWNGSLSAGSSTQAGANFTYTGTNAAPASVTCTPAGSTTPPPTPSITATPASLQVVQGATGTFTLALSSAPTANVTVAIAASGNTGLTEAPTSLTFTPSNYATAQTVTVTADSSSTGTTTFTASATGYTAATVTATETTKATTGSGTAPVVGITSPTAGTIFKPGSSVTLTAGPVAGSGNVTSVSFYQSTSAANDTLIGVATASGGQFTYNWANVPAGSYSITAVASNGTESITSYPVAITVENPTVVINPVSVTVAQGRTQTFGVSLSAAPSASTTVSLAVSGDSDLTVSPAPR